MPIGKCQIVSSLFSALGASVYTPTLGITYNYNNIRAFPCAVFLRQQQCRRKIVFVIKAKPMAYLPPFFNFFNSSK